MFCPVCKGVELLMSDRQGIEIDYCPTCRGVWLDRGELEKLVERSVQLERGGPAPAPGYAREPSHGHDDRRDFKNSGHGYKDYGHAQQGQRRSFWRDLFD
jgi:hypothetical protein